MAEAQIPTFKLVLVGDGGTGKVSRHHCHHWRPASRLALPRLRGRKVGTGLVNNISC